MRKAMGVLLAIALVTGVAFVANRPGPAGAQGGGTIEATVTYAGAPVVEKLKVKKDTEKCGTEASIEKVRDTVFAVLISERQSAADALARVEQEHAGDALVQELVQSVRASERGRQGRSAEPMRSA